MKKRKFDDGGEVDAMESANKGEDLAAELRGENTLKNMRDAAAAKKPMAKPKPKPMVSAPKASPAPAAPAAAPRSASDETKMSLSDRIKMSRERARTSSTGTDTRSVGQRIRSAFGMKDGGSVSSRADGVAQRGKTRGKMC